MPATLRSLAAESRFRFTAVADVPDEILDAPVLSAHSSDLSDPTPWLESGQLLLTDGLQFRSGQTVADEYVIRLVERGILALGFATHIVHDGIPADVVEACRVHGLPLFEVGRETPFMGIIRHVADVGAAEQRARLEESLAALRAVARAALRPDGLAAILRELEKNLGCWVAIYDAAGSRIAVPTRRSMPEHVQPLVEEGVRRALDGRRPAGVRLAGPDGAGVTLQTLGQTAQLRGVLAVGIGASIDRAGTDLVDSVIALASIALEQSRAVDDARRRLRTGVAELMHAGLVDVAGGAAKSLWGDLPREPFRLAVVVAPEGVSDALHAALELLAERERGQVFFAEREDELYVIAPDEARDRLRRTLAEHGAAAGFSAPSRWPDFRRAEEEAHRAARRLGDSVRFLSFEDLLDAGLLGHLEVTGAQTLARRILLPLREEDAASGGSLEETLLVWLEHNGAWDPAAKALGIHRHTLRARVDAAGRLLDLDLSEFGARAEVWSALQLARR